MAFQKVLDIVAVRKSMSKTFILFETFYKTKLLVSEKKIKWSAHKLQGVTFWPRHLLQM